MNAYIDFARADVSKRISHYLEKMQIFAVIGEGGSGKRASAEIALADRRFVLESGNSNIGGFLAGFHDLIENIWSSCEEKHPELISRFEQALKRLFPQKHTSSFRCAKDLTQTSSKKERTRFYHHEYQLKLLHSLFEFIDQALYAERSNIVLVIDDAHKLSPTGLSFLRLIVRKLEPLSNRIQIVLLCDAECEAALIAGGEPIRVGPIDYEYASKIIRSASPEIAPAEAELLWIRSRGNLLLLNRILECHKKGLTAAGYLDSCTMLDFLLDHYDQDTRTMMLENFISAHCLDDDPLVRRNYEIALIATKDKLHRAAHQSVISAYYRGEDRLRLVHALSLTNPAERLAALCEPGEILKGIGLYDTWLAFFSQWFVDAEARRAQDGNDDVSHAFVNVAFVLYSLGMGKVAIPFLELFYECYPESRLVPTVIYAQSMTYGRYMTPVDLPRANALAEKNLEIIDRDFRHLETYEYIKIFAENALAYIRARQGRFDEALLLCKNGIDRMTEIYGSKQFILHQSILIYNTAQVYEIMKNFEEAEYYYRKAIDMDPYYGEYYNDIANLLCKIKGREEEAIKNYTTAIQLCPSYYEAYLNRALLFRHLGELDKAIEDCKRALDISPSETRASLTLGGLLLEADSAEEACRVLLNGTRYNQSADLLVNLTFARLEVRDAEGAYEAALEAVRLAPDRADARNNLAIAAVELGDLDEALKNADAAVDLAQFDPDYQQTRNYISKLKENTN